MHVPPYEPHRPREATALHEAAHAVAATVVGRTVTSVTIVPDVGGWGCCEYAPFEPVAVLAYRDDPRNRKQAIITLAGSVAERRRFKDTDPRYASADMTHVDNLIGFMLGNADSEEEEELRADMRAETERLVATHWGAIEALAAALLERPTLTGEEVAAIIAAASTATPDARP